MIAYPLDVQGVLTRVLEAGPADGAPILFLHGTANHAGRWVHNLEAQAAAGRRAFAIDLPGHGFAQKDAQALCTVPGYADFAAAFLEQVAPGQAAVVVGTSLGGHVAARLAVTRPRAVHALVLVGSMGLVPIGPEARARIQGGASNQGRDAVATKFTRIVRDPGLVTPQWIDEEHRINNSPGAVDALTRLGRYIGERLDDDLAGPRLAAVDVPKLLVWGAVDPVVPLAVGQAAHALLPGSRLAVIADTAHTPYLENPAAFNRLLDDFLAGTLGTRAIADVELA